MTKITALRPSAHDSELVYIELGETGSLKSTASVVTQLALYVGQELDAEKLDELKSASSASGAYASALRIVSHRQVSRHELITKLREKGVAQEDAESAAERLEGLGIVDDAAYAKTLAKHYSARGYGAGRVKSELSKRGVPRECWDEALSVLESSETDLAPLFEKLMRGQPPDRKNIKRVSDALYRRGFSWEQISSACEEYRREHTEGQG